MDWAEACRILGVSESATDAEIKEQYIYKAQLLHPDKNQDKPENVRRRAETELALVNQAYSFANQPNNNPYKVPPKLAIEPMAIHFKDVGIGEKKAGTLIIRNTGGPYTSVWMDNQPAPWLAVTGVRSIDKERLPLEVALECTGMGESGRQYTCDLAVKLENENTHAIDNAAVKIELNTRLGTAAPYVANGAILKAKKINREIPHNRPIAPLTPKNKMGFSIKAFLVNLAAFAILGFVLNYFVGLFVKADQQFVLIGLIIYAVIVLGISVNHSINIGSKT